MILVAHHDFETASALDLRKCGVHRYAEHPSTRIWCMSWRLGDDGPVQHWRPGYPDPVPLLEHVARGGIMKAHNAAFERTIWNRLLRVRYCPHWPELRIEQQDCTMARAAVLAIPQSLEICGKVLGARVTKDMEGNALMRKAAKPRKALADGEMTWWDDDETIDRIEAYCDQDILAETEVDLRCPPLSPAERAVWELDQRINDRGVLLDRALIEHALHVRAIALVSLDQQMAQITGGAVQRCSEVAKLVAWIESRGLICNSVAKAEQDDLLRAAEREGLLDVAEAIRLRQRAAKTSTAKLQAMLDCMCEDGRARGLLHYHGTNTGRWAGRLIQPQNLYRVDPERDGDTISRALDVLLAHDGDDAHDMLAMLFGDPLSVLAKTLRSMIVAERGRKLVGADLSNIEGRLAAWISGEEWKLEAFRAFDAGRGPDLYRVAYARSFGIEPHQVTGAQRQIGKVEELALAYQGSVGSFISMAKVYGLRPSGLVDPVRSAAPDDFAYWSARYDGAKDKHGLPKEQWAAIKVIVAGWRAAHPKLVGGWWELQDAAVDAVLTPNTPIPALNGRVAYLNAKGFLWCRLPSGRVLAYCAARVRQETEAWIEMPNGVRHEEGELFDYEIAALMTQGGTRKTRKRNVVLYEGYEGESREWTTFSLYGGKQFNHIVQATARDVMVGAMLRAEERGYPVVLTVHDELLTEPFEWWGSPAEMEQIMTEGEPWLDGCPLAAKAWEGHRYGK